MPKLVHRPIKIDRSKTHNQNLVNAINEFWKMHVASCSKGYVESTLYRGVPRIAREPSYKHPDIVWVWRDVDGKWNVRK
jgi:hypothetical protein